LALEETSLLSELEELKRAVNDISNQRDGARTEHQTLIGQRRSLLESLDAERRALITPALAQLERLHRVLGQLNQQIRSLTRLATFRDRVSVIEKERILLEEELGRLRAQTALQVSDRGLIAERTGQLAQSMNEFVSRLPLQAGLGGLITIDPSDFSFYVGKELWSTGLGNERRVLFLLAYHYAGLVLSNLPGVPHPGFAILDNPFQQDVSPNFVQEGLDELATLMTGDTGVQVIVATRRDLEPIPANRLHLRTVYNPEALPKE